MYSDKIKKGLVNEEELCDSTPIFSLQKRIKNNVNRVPLSLRITIKFSPNAAKIRLCDVKILLNNLNNDQQKGNNLIF